MKKMSDAGIQKLKSSGLTAKDAEVLGISFLTREQTPKQHEVFKQLSSLRIDYRDHNGKAIIDPWTNKPFFRVRYLEAATDFDAQTKKKPVRYAQPPGTMPHAYFPSNADWGKVLANKEQTLIITEGEFKAAKATKEGFPTIGLGGVYNWRSLKQGIDWLPSLEPVDWRRRKVSLCFDSDLKTNAMVQAALRELGEQLQRRGAHVHLVTLPQLKGLEKVGVDDFLVNAGANAPAQLADLLAAAAPLGLTRVLWELNDKYLYVREPGLILNRGSLAKVTPNAFKEHAESSAEYHEGELKDGDVKYTAVSASGAWLKWPLRGEVSKLTYRPAAEKFVDGQFNIWPGWGVEPKKGNIKPFLQLVDHMFTGAEPEAKMWFLRWCAYPLQFPGTKLFTSAVVHGIKHGTGKSFLGFTLGRIYGKNFTEISQMDLHNHFNEWAEGKQLVMGDDVTGHDKRADADFLKKLITQREIRINGKYLPTYVVPDCVNYFFTANHPDSFFLEDDDRRFFIHEVLVGPLPESFYVDYELWLDTGGSAAVFEYLMQLDLASFNPAGPAFKTAAKERMISNVQSDLASWVRQLKTNPDHVLKVGDVNISKDLFTSAELLNLYDYEHRTKTTANGVGRELARAGIRQIADGRPIRLKNGTQSRFYAVRRGEKWLTAKVVDAVKHLEDFETASSKPHTKPKKY